MRPPFRRRRTGWALGVLAAVSLPVLPAGAAAGRIDSPPVLLRKSPLTTPLETAGTGLAPEVKVRVTVDPRGRVSGVDVLSIDPASEYDDLFRKITVETIESWRYAPARSGGEPVETTLEWSIQFEPKAGHPGYEESLGAALEEDARRAEVFTLPYAQQAEALRRLAALAEKQLAPETRRRADTPRFLVISDAASADTAQVVAGNLEAVFDVLEATFRPGIEPQPAHYKLVAYVFARRSSFAALIEELTAPEWANGLYAPPGLLVFHLEADTVENLLSTLVHEAVHAYADQHLVRPGSTFPPWITEGLASYFGNSEIRKGRLIPGSTSRGKYVINPRARGGAVRLRSTAAWTLDQVKQAIRGRTAIGVPKLLAANPTLFYGENVSLHYSLSWMFVHFLRHGRPDSSDEEFGTLLLYLSEGFATEAALEAVYGLSPAELEEPFRTYVRSF